MLSLSSFCMLPIFKEHVHDYPAICKCSLHDCFLLIHLHANGLNEQLKTKGFYAVSTLLTVIYFIFFLSELCDVYGGNVLCVNLISTIH